ncbi:MAG TPA: efflux RND transporter periplasmic adaptor subunit [Planktothrix sp.]|jgi:RND family efflux transporter MFP subunit
MNNQKRSIIGARASERVKQRFAAMAIVGIVVTLLSACSGDGQNSTPVGEADPRAEPVLKLPITKVKVETLSEKLSLPGTVLALPDRSVKVSPGVAGKIVDVKVTPGQQVQKGSVIALLDNRQPQEQVNQARAKVLIADAGVEQAKTNLVLAQNTEERLARLVKQEVAAEKDLVAAKSQIETAQAQLLAAKAQVDDARAAEQTARAQLGYTIVRSPLSGIIAQRYLNISDSADTSTPVAQVVDLSQVIVEAALPTSQPASLSPGDSATVTAQALPGRVTIGKVLNINPVTDNQGTTIGVRILCPNPNYALKEGMPVAVSIVNAVHSNILTVPKTAVVADPQAPDSKMVYTYKNGKVSRVQVTTGIAACNRQQILSGLKAGEEIVASGAYGIPDGTEVKAENEPLHGNSEVTSKSD